MNVWHRRQIVSGSDAPLISNQQRRNRLHNEGLICTSTAAEISDDRFLVIRLNFTFSNAQNN